MRRIGRRVGALIASAVLAASVVIPADVSIMAGEPEETTDVLGIVNSDFSVGPWDEGAGWISSFDSWENSPTISQAEGKYNFWSAKSDDHATFMQSLTFPAGEYVFSLKTDGANANVYMNIGDNWGSTVSLSGYQDYKFATLAVEFEEETTADLVLHAYITAEQGWGYLRELTYTYTAPDSGSLPDVELPVGLQNGDFESGLDYWTAGAAFSVKKGEGKNTGNLLNVWDDNKGDVSISQTFKTEEAGDYYLSYDYIGNDGDSGLDIFVNDTKLDDITATGWGDGTWSSKELTGVTVSLEEGQTVTITISGTFAQWVALDNIALTKVEETPEPVVERSFELDDTPCTGTAATSEIYVEPVALTNGFITGADISSYLSIVNSGATYKDAAGNVLDGAGFFGLLKSSGVNYVRIRVWNDPTDGNGHGYGGGNCDIEAAKVMGKLATDAGLRVLVDFHCSDFWTDPGKQNAPKAWADKSLDQKAEALRNYIQTSIEALIDAGVDVGMVQVGNETTSGFCGESNMTNMCTLFKAGSEGVMAAEESKSVHIMIAIHLTNPEKGNFSNYAKSLKDNGVTYDVFATSYYPYWHGTLENLKTQLNTVATTYGKYVMVAETSYVRTLEDGDGHDNTISSGEGLPYEVSEQGQVTHIRNVIDAVKGVSDSKGIGVFWWEPAWIPVGNVAAAEDPETVKVSNKLKWEEFGSGWAASYAGDYDSGAKQWYGGSAVDNESWFDFDGRALESINVYNY